MNEPRDDEDRDLRSLLAATEAVPADEPFVTAVTRGIARRRHLTTALCAGAAVASAAAVLVVLPFVLPLATTVAEFPATHAATAVAFLVSPMGGALSIVLGGLVLVRAVTSE